MTIMQSIYLFTFLFVLLNQTNTYFLTREKLNRYIAPCRHTIQGELTSILGNVAVLFIFIFIGNLSFAQYRSFMIYILAVSFFLNSICLALSVYTQYFGTAFSKEGMEMFKNPARAIIKGLPLEFFKELILYYRIILFLPSLVLLAYYFTLDGELLRQTILPKDIGLNIALILLFFGILYIQKTIFDHQFRQGLAIKSVKSTYSIQNLGVYPYYLSPISIFSYRRKMEKILNYKTEEELYPQFDAINKNKPSYINILDQKTYHNVLRLDEVSKTIHIDASLRKNDNSLQGILKGKKLVLVQVESLNHFILALQQTAKERPFLDTFFKECLLFNRFYTSVGIGVSSDAEVATQTGLYPSGFSNLYWHRYDLKKKVYKDVPRLTTLPKYFKASGYETHAVHGDEGGFYNRKQAYPHILGFDDFHACEDFENKIVARRTPTLTLYASDYLNRKHISPWVSDYEVARYVASILPQKDKQMLFPITMMPHTPFEFNPEPNRLVFPTSAGLFAITERYLNFTYYYDRFISRFFIDEKGNNITDTNAVYFFYGDHGSGLKNGDLNQLFNRTLTNEEERLHLLHLGCFMYVPGTKLTNDGIYEGLIKGEQNLVRGQIDTYRTILELFDLPRKQDLYMGVHLFSQEPSYVIDNKLLDVVVDEGLFSMRDIENKFPSTYHVSDALYKHIRTQKLLNDLLYKDPHLEERVNQYFNRIKRESI